MSGFKPYRLRTPHCLDPRCDYVTLLQSIMVAIGTNNLGYGMSAEDTVGGIKAVVKVKRKQQCPITRMCVCFFWVFYVVQLVLSLYDMHSLRAVPSRRTFASWASVGLLEELSLQLGCLRIAVHWSRKSWQVTSNLSCLCNPVRVYAFFVVYWTLTLTPLQLKKLREVSIGGIWGL